ncbi:hypothetical protein ANAPC1_00509 [Anaplasma phagocytophilum]|uniref:Uncharacterized protein n=1 Tax=Anaplasma phagocytophilum TaxID=948 RepID=A0AA45USY5_ANAPH|nr:hypothetical protein ANAPC1_00509 [Anaplasma phagocytophilum]
MPALCIVTCVALALTKKLKKSLFQYSADTTDGPYYTEKESEYLSSEQ